MHYLVDPGLYAVGTPDAGSPVFVTANYKMSFDYLRAALVKLSAWILVLDTQGVNVWCAAGKRTFGTEELVERIRTSGLASITETRTLLLPQLAAPGVSAHLVKRLSGFRVVYGPINASDIPAFLESGLKASPAMRRKTFSIGERLVLIPVELVAALKAAFWLVMAFFLLGGLSGVRAFWTNAISSGLLAVYALTASIAAGAIVTPLLLPWLPGRAFSVKGVIPAVAAAACFVMTALLGPGHQAGAMELAGWCLIIPAIVTYLSMNFTGASTYTSLSGVRTEMRYAVPCQILAAGSGVFLWLWAKFGA